MGLRARLVETLVPVRLGKSFRWLLASSWSSNLSDGIALAAGPLLVASQTDQAFLVALAALVQWAPPLLFGLYAGALTDRLNRKAIVITVNLVRVVILVFLAIAVLTGAISIWLVLTSLFLLGTAELFADNASTTLLPMIVQRDDLAIANSRLQTGFVTVNQLGGPPLGAALFAAGMAWPFLAQPVLLLAGAVLVTRVVLPDHRRDRAASTRIHTDIAEGFRWTVRHAAIRTLVLTLFTFNITFGAAWSVLVLYAARQLGLDEVGFGLITTVMALGGLVGSFTYGWLTKRVSLGNLMRIGLIIETITHLTLALTTDPYLAMVIFFVFGAHTFVWSTTSTTVRHRAVPTELQGRVGSVNRVGSFGGLVIGSALGGVLAQVWGVTAPFWFAFIGSAIFVVLIWRQLAHIAHDEMPPLISDP